MEISPWSLLAEVSDALSYLVEVDGQSGTKYPEHLLLLACAMHSPDFEVADLARSRLREGMASECSWVSYNVGGGVIPGNARESPTTLPEAPKFFEEQQRKVQASLSKFTMLTATARFHLPNEIRTTLERPPGAGQDPPGAGGPPLPRLDQFGTT